MPLAKITSFAVRPGGAVVNSPYLRWSFTGNGTTQSYDLPDAFGLLPSSYLVYIDGVVQDPINFTISNTNPIAINFSSPIPNGSVVTIISLGGAIPSTDVSNYTATATGTSTSRQIEDRFADVINVKDFGATGNGTTDDTAAIQAAITNSNGKSVYIPKGTYSVNQLTCTGNINIYGDGDSSILKKRTNELNDAGILNIYNGTVAGNVVYAENVYINNIKFVGLYTEPNVATLKDQTLVFITWAKNINIVQCSFSNTEGKAVFVRGGCNNININSCNFYKTALSFLSWPTYGYFPTGVSQNIKIQNCSFIKNCVRNMNIFSKSICIQNYLDPAEWGAGNSSGHIIDSNYFEDAGTIPLELWSGTSRKVTNSCVSNNVIVFTEKDIGCWGISISTCENINVTSNNIKLFNDNNGLGLEIVGSYSIAASNNVIDTRAGNSDMAAIYLNGKDIVLDSNIVNFNGGKGLFSTGYGDTDGTYKTSSNIKITNNIFTKTGNAYAVGTWIQDTDYVDFTGNIIRGLLLSESGGVNNLFGAHMWIAFQNNHSVTNVNIDSNTFIGDANFYNIFIYNNNKTNTITNFNFINNDGTKATWSVYDGWNTDVSLNEYIALNRLNNRFGDSANSVKWWDYSSPDQILPANTTNNFLQIPYISGNPTVTQANGNESGAGLCYNKSNQHLFLNDNSRWNKFIPHTGYQTSYSTGTTTGWKQILWSNGTNGNFCVALKIYIDLHFSAFVIVSSRLGYGQPATINVLGSSMSQGSQILASAIRVTDSTVEASYRYVDINIGADGISRNMKIIYDCQPFGIIVPETITNAVTTSTLVTSQNL
jgi:hypothetical protein